MNQGLTEKGGVSYGAALKRLGFLRIGFLRRCALVRKNLPHMGIVLDVGAASGAMLEELAAQNCGKGFFVGLEPGFALAAMSRLPMVCAYATSIPFRDDTFDAVICSATRKHVRDSSLLMSEIARVLRPGGRVVIIDPHPWLIRLGIFTGKFDRRYVHHVSHALEICEEMRRAGIEPASSSTGIFICCVGEKSATRRQNEISSSCGPDEATDAQTRVNSVPDDRVSISGESRKDKRYECSVRCGLPLACGSLDGNADRGRSGSHGPSAIGSITIFARARRFEI